MKWKRQRWSHFLGVINDLCDVLLDDAALVEASVDAVGEEEADHDEDEDSAEDEEEVFMEIELIFCVNHTSFFMAKIISLYHFPPDSQKSKLCLKYWTV